MSSTFAQHLRESVYHWFGRCRSLLQPVTLAAGSTGPSTIPSSHAYVLLLCAWHLILMDQVLSDMPDR